MTPERASARTGWLGLGLQLILIWAAIFGGYELLERFYLRNSEPWILHLLHILRGSGTAFLLAFLGVRGVYRRREAFVIEAKDRLEAEKLKQDEILSELGAGLIVLDSNFHILYANPQAQKWFGTKIPGSLCLTAECAMGKESSVCPAREALGRGSRFGFEERIETSEGTRHLYVTATPLPSTRDNPGGGIIELVQDVTALKEMEARLRQSVAAARIGAISSGIAHQLGNPLSAISAAVERLHALGISRHESYARYLQRIELESDRAAQIVRTLMDLARRIGAQVDTANHRAAAGRVRQAVQAAVDMQAARRTNMDEVLRLHLCDGEDPEVRMGQTELQEVLVNLLDNAFEAAAHLERPRISIHVARSHGDVLLMVCDNGPGVDESLRDKIFEPFFTTRKTGSGLGLFLCREMVEASGGEIRVDHLPAGGARFVVRWPAVEMGDPRKQPAGAAL